MKVPARAKKHGKQAAVDESAAALPTAVASVAAPTLAMPGLARRCDDPQSVRRKPTAAPAKKTPGWQTAASPVASAGGPQVAATRRPAPAWTSATPTGTTGQPPGVLGGSRRPATAPASSAVASAPAVELGYYDEETSHGTPTAANAAQLTSSVPAPPEAPEPQNATASYSARTASRVVVAPQADAGPYNTGSVEPDNGRAARVPQTQPQVGPVAAAAAPRGPAPLPSLAPKQGPGAGTSRKHRAFQVNKLPDTYAEETKTHDQQGHARQNSLAGGGIGFICGYVRLHWKALTAPETLTHEECQDVFDLATTRAGFDKPWTWQNLRGAASLAHAHDLDWLRRQDLTVTDEGVLLQKLPGGKLQPYPTDAKGNPIIDDRHVSYDRTPESQEATRVEFRGGKLFRSATHAEKGGPVDTTKSVTHFSGPGYEIFVADEKNEIHMASHKIGKYHHSSLLNGGNVSMAGELKVVDGKITFMSNKSGHYNPSEASFTQFLRFLQKDGITLDFEVNDFSNARKMTAQEWLDGKQEGGNYDPSKTFEAIKTNVVWRAFIEEFGYATVMAVITAQGWRWQDTGIVDSSGAKVDLKLIRRLLKQELGGKRGGQGRQGKVKVDTNKMGVTVDSEWKS